MSGNGKISWFSKALPAIILMLMAPLIAEVLPGATRLSAIFVFPIEVLIWGGGTVMIRYFVRKYRLGWFNLLLLAVALSVAEEFLIQQTSVAPVVIQLKGVEYARAFGINYVYWLWATLYEAIFVVLIPIALTEMMFEKRKDSPWLSAWGLGVITVLFVPACCAAWYSWTQIARTQVFHLPDYDLPQSHAIAGAAMIAGLVLLALGPTRRLLAGRAKPLTPPHPLVVAVLGVAVSLVIFAVEILAFGIAPDVPPAAPMAAGLVLTGLLMLLLPRYLAHESWGRWHQLSMTLTTVLGNFAVMFIAFQGASAYDLWGKIIMDVVAAVLMLWLTVAYVRRPR